MVVGSRLRLVLVAPALGRYLGGHMAEWLGFSAPCVAVLPSPYFGHPDGVMSCLLNG